MREIIVVDYDPFWKDVFLKFKTEYLSVLDGLDVDIQHVGSTSVEGLSAKPIIDIDIIVEDEDTLKMVIKGLETIGYEHVGNLGVTGREAFKLIEPNPNLGFDHHLYAGFRDSIAIRNHLIFRDYLRNNPEAVREYSELKKSLAKKFTHDIDSYIEGKTNFIIGILDKFDITQEDLNIITEDNKIK